MDTLHYSGHLYFRHRLVLSILAGKTIKIDKIRPADKDPGLRGALSHTQRRRYPLNEHPDYEVSLLRLIEKVTNGTIIEISLTGVPYLCFVQYVTNKARYCNPRQAWNYLWGAGLPRMPSFTIHRIFSGTYYYACSVFEKAACLNSQRHHYGRQGSVGASVLDDSTYPFNHFHQG
jgi:hypothetical protein